MNSVIYTVGHSTQSIEQFVQLLLMHKITAIADVRSAPYSRYNPQFNREELSQSLKLQDIQYVFLGKELGARSDEDCCYVDGRVNYSILAKTKLFQHGIERVVEGVKSHKIALMCAEKDPLDCHRTILVSRELINHGYSVAHILSDGLIELHEDAMLRLVERLGLSEVDLFRSVSLTIEDAYETQGRRIAYSGKPKQFSYEKSSISSYNEGKK